MYPTKKQVTTKPPDIDPVAEHTRRAFNALSADERRYVLAARSDNIPYRGESFEDFIRVVDETERLRANPKWLEELKAGGLAGEIRKALNGG